MAEVKNLFVSIIVEPSSRGEPWHTEARGFAIEDVRKMKQVMAKQPNFICEATKTIRSTTEMDGYLRSLASRSAEYADLVVFISAYTKFFKKDTKPIMIFCPDKVYNLRGKMDQYFESVDYPAMVPKNKLFFIQGCCPPKYGPVDTDGPGDVEMPTKANVSFYWCEIPGKDFVRDGSSASVYHFCQIVNDLEEETSLDIIFTEVNRRLGEDLPDKVLPDTNSTATGIIILRPTGQQ